MTIDTSPQALRRLADFLADRYDVTSYEADAALALRAVADEKERFTQEQYSAAYWAGFDDGRSWVEQKQDEAWL